MKTILDIATVIAYIFLFAMLTYPIWFKLLNNGVSI